MVGLNTIQLKQTTQKATRKKKTDFNKILDDLKQKDWSDILHTEDVNAAAEKFTCIVSNLLNTHTSEVKTSRTERNLKPWITIGLLRCMRHRDRLHLQAKQNPNNETFKLTYTRYRNFCNTILRKRKEEHESEKITKTHKDPKQLWKTIREVCDIKKPKMAAQELLAGHVSPKAVLNSCNSHLATIGANLASDILQRLDETEDSLCKKLKEMSHSTSSLYLCPTDLLEVNQLIANLKSDSAPGVDALTPALLKHIKPAILVPLTHIFNLSIKSGVFPECWKTAIVCPIHKGGPKNTIENYRPISLLPVISKILEKIINNRLVSFLDKFNLLSDHQYGFRRGRCTEDAVGLVTSSMAKNMDQGNKCVGVFLDLARAFDSLSRVMLLRKLESYGVRGNALAWFISYLSHRRQRLKIGDDMSDEQEISFGVPQGSILAPTLFTIYMDGILRLKFPNGELICFADDTLGLFHGPSWEAATHAAERGMLRISEWLDENLLTLNVNKTKFIGFHITNATASNIDAIKIHVKSCPVISFPVLRRCTCQQINRVARIRYLGVELDEKLTFEAHISSLSKKVRKFIYLMKSLRPIKNIAVKRMVYTALCQSLLQYCISAWGGAAKTFMISLERAQRAVLKVLLGKPRRYPTADLYQDAQVLSVRKLFIMKAVTKSQILMDTPHTNSLIALEPVQLPEVRTVFASRLPPYIHLFVYNSVINTCPLKVDSHRKARAKIKRWLQTISYVEVEKMVKVHSKESGRNIQIEDLF